ncbi:MAG: chemotaxis protein [bacterium]|nr:chemotaxis protein [bacterium]
MSGNGSVTCSKGILLETGTNEVEFLEFTVCGQRFGVNVAKVTQALVWKDQKVTQLPGAEYYFKGTVPFRKKHIPVIDLKTYLTLPGESVSFDKQLLLVMEFNQKTNGFLVDGVEEIQRVSWDKFVPFSEISVCEGEPCVTGTVTIEDRVIMILDMEAMMASVDSSMSVENFAKQIDVNEKIDRSSVRILYCEDSPIIQKVTVKTLNTAGFKNIKVFATGAKGLNYLQENSAKDLDIILSDIEMPELDGLAFCKSVKSHPEWSKLPFIFFSSLINDQMRLKCESVQGNASFSKPEIHMIVDAIERLYKKSKQDLL